VLIEPSATLTILQSNGKAHAILTLPPAHKRYNSADSAAKKKMQDARERWFDAVFFRDRRGVVLACPGPRVVLQHWLDPDRACAKEIWREVAWQQPVAFEGEAGYQVELLMPGVRFKFSFLSFHDEMWSANRRLFHLAC
jgi:hypothetical protein